MVGVMRLLISSLEHDMKVRIEDLALHDPNEQVRLEAIRQVTNRKVMEQAYYNDPSGQVKSEAFHYLNARNLLSEEELMKVVNRQDIRLYVVREALHNIHNQEFLKNYVSEDWYWGTRSDAIDNITDIKFLTRITEGMLRGKNTDMLIDKAKERLRTLGYGLPKKGK
jgi:hypothetical protein